MSSLILWLFECVWVSSFAFSQDRVLDSRQSVADFQWTQAGHAIKGLHWSPLRLLSINLWNMLLHRKYLCDLQESALILLKDFQRKINPRKQNSTRDWANSVLDCDFVFIFRYYQHSYNGVEVEVTIKIFYVLTFLDLNVLNVNITFFFPESTV